ncbi:hypothetical protein HPT25_22170 [Bacillus sp. BRMEA1]|uniref:hypothetical protein n=1 Tax=Neobacillus endophyticus TaxID=2738405 RepID=UPI0015643011|nr:hypothetical protein [Neobacillus endophyticus]NRD80047.1 hypothetical protein [Neobacillus endophyticus]
MNRRNNFKWSDPVWNDPGASHLYDEFKWSGPAWNNLDASIRLDNSGSITESGTVDSTTSNPTEEYLQTSQVYDGYRDNRVTAYDRNRDTSDQSRHYNRNRNISAQESRYRSRKHKSSRGSRNRDNVEEIIKRILDKDRDARGRNRGRDSRNQDIVAEIISKFL